MVLQGLRASNGVHTGPAIALSKPKEWNKLHPGSVMVVSDTDPDWMPAFEFLAKNGGAIVTETGGRLCHAAITSRELKIPCVVGVKNAMELINGKDVEVDGSRGFVSIR